MKKLVLASGSPRRKQLLDELGFKFQTLSIEISEIPNKNLSLNHQIEDLALQKAKAVADKYNLLKSQDILVLSADTVVVHQQQIIGKPQDESQATQYLTLLSNTSHQVITGLCLWDLNSNKIVTAHETSTVFFKKLTLQEIRNYVLTKDPMDKAGAYGVQGEARKFILKVEGSIENVMGLPVQLLLHLFKVNGWEIEHLK